MATRGAWLALGLTAAALGAELQVENLGSPIRIRELGVQVVTPTAAGGYIAWGWQKSEGLVGVDTATGKSFELDLRKYRPGNVAMTRGPAGDLFFYAGAPGRFFRYTTAGKLEELGIPDTTASYWIGGHRGANDVLYVGTYPGATVVACDMKTAQVRSHGRLTEDERQKYVIAVAVADDGVIYAATGLHHQELWSLDPASGAKQQILPESLTAIQGAPRIWTGTDGQVYGQSGNTTWRCTPTGIEEGATQDPRRDPGLMMAGDARVITLDGEGMLHLAKPGEEAPTRVPTDYSGRTPGIYCLGGERGGKLYGGTVFPGRPFTVDLETGALAEVKGVAPQVIQIYDIASLAEGLFFASYMGCILDFFNPDAPRVAGENPVRFRNRVNGHERPNQWEVGPDGKLYFGTVPAKGRLGGALVQVDPASREVKVWNQIMPDLSILYVAAIPETGLLFGCTSVGGGSSAIPLRQEAEAFLWDTATETVAWQGTPVPGTKTYGRARCAANGLIVGLAGQSWYLFDPATRSTVHVGALPVQRLRFPNLGDVLVGPRQWVIGLGDDAVFAIDAAAREVRVLGTHPSLNSAHGFHATAAGQLFYGSQDSVYRCRLPLE